MRCGWGKSLYTNSVPRGAPTPALPRQRGRERTVSAPWDDEALLLGLARILDGVEGLELDVVELAVDLLDLADVDVLDDVAGFRINRDRAAWALPGHALHRGKQRIAIRLALGLLHGLVDQVDAIVAADRHKPRTAAERLLVGGDEILVLRRRMRHRIHVRGHGTEHRVAHVVEQVVVGHVARPDHLDAALVEPALGI